MENCLSTQECLIIFSKNKIMRLKKRYKSLLNGKDFFLNQNVCPIILIDTHIFLDLLYVQFICLYFLTLKLYLNEKTM